MRVHERDARDRAQLARALVQQELDVREGLEAATEARLRLAHPFRDGADATVLGRVHVEDPVGLAEPERAQHDRLGLGAPGHEPSLGSPGVVALCL